jgi:hypothetical protein
LSVLDRQFCRVSPFEDFIYERSGSFEVVRPEGSKSRSAVVSCLGDRHVGTPSTEGWNQHETARVNHTAGLLLPTGYSY